MVSMRSAVTLRGAVLRTTNPGIGIIIVMTVLMIDRMMIGHIDGDFWSNNGRGCQDHQ